MPRSSDVKNRREWAARRHSFNNPLRDSRGARGRAKQIRDILRQDASPEALAAAVAEGLRDDVEQLALWPGLDALDTSAVASTVACPGSWRVTGLTRSRTCRRSRAASSTRWTC